MAGPVSFDFLAGRGVESAIGTYLENAMHRRFKGDNSPVTLLYHLMEKRTEKLSAVDLESGMRDYLLSTIIPNIRDCARKTGIPVKEVENKFEALLKSGVIEFYEGYIYPDPNMSIEEYVCRTSRLPELEVIEMRINHGYYQHVEKAIDIGGMTNDFIGKVINVPIERIYTIAPNYHAVVVSQILGRKRRYIIGDCKFWKNLKTKSSKLPETTLIHNERVLFPAKQTWKLGSPKEGIITPVSDEILGYVGTQPKHEFRILAQGYFLGNDGKFHLTTEENMLQFPGMAESAVILDEVDALHSAEDKFGKIARYNGINSSPTPIIRKTTKAEIVKNEAIEELTKKLEVPKGYT